MRCGLGKKTRSWKRKWYVKLNEETNAWSAINLSLASFSIQLLSYIIQQMCEVENRRLPAVKWTDQWQCEKNRWQGELVQMGIFGSDVQVSDANLSAGESSKNPSDSGCWRSCNWLQRPFRHVTRFLLWSHPSSPCTVISSQQICNSCFIVAD